MIHGYRFVCASTFDFRVSATSLKKRMVFSCQRCVSFVFFD